MTETLDLDAIEAAEVKAGLDWTLENAHPLLMAIGPLVDEVRKLRQKLAEADEAAYAWRQAYGASRMLRDAGR